MGKYCGYGCVSSATLPRTNPEVLKTTKSYRELELSFNRMKLSPDLIYIDLLTGNYRKRRKFEKILEDFGYGDCVVIESLHSLGFNTQEVLDNYKALFKKDIGLLIAEEDFKKSYRYSTATTGLCIDEDIRYKDFRYSPYILAVFDEMKSLDIKTRQGRGFMERPENFKKVYWLYENYFLAEKDTYHNNLIDIGKKRFRRLAQEYEEKDIQYEADLKEQEQLYQISKKPKRHGTIPEDFGKFLALIDSGETIEKACNIMHYPHIPHIDVDRYRLKYEGGRSAMAMANQCREQIEVQEMIKDIIKT